MHHADCCYLQVVEDDVELIWHRDVPAEEERAPGLAPLVQHLPEVSRQHRLADHPVQGVVREQEVLEVGELSGYAELVDISQNLGNLLIK